MYISSEIIRVERSFHVGITSQSFKNKKKLKKPKILCPPNSKLDYPFLIIQQEIVLWTFLDQTWTNYCHWRCVKLV